MDLLSRFEVAAVVGDKVVEISRSSRAVSIRLRLRFFAIDVMKQGSEDLPSDVELVVTNKVGVISLERIQNQCSKSYRASVLQRRRGGEN